MAYAHCHNCGWQQDDWWSNSYKPIDTQRLEEFNNKLLDAAEDPSKRMSSKHDSVWLEERFGVKNEVDIRALVATELERIAAKIRTMHFWSEEEYINMQLPCPRCGSTEHMDVD